MMRNNLRDISYDFAIGLNLKSFSYQNKNHVGAVNLLHQISSIYFITEKNRELQHFCVMSENG